MQLRGRSAVITGAGSGIGRAIAERFAAEGARILAADVDAAGLAETVRLIEAGGGRAAARPCDVADPAAVAAMIKAAVETFGGIDILVNNAGIGIQRRFLDTTRNDLERILAVNLVGAFDVARGCARRMVDQGRGGRIINMASIAGQRGSAGRAAYGASKAGLINLTQVMAVELAGHEIAVNAIAPGPIETPIVKVMHSAATREAWRRTVPAGRYGSPQEIANAALFLAGEGASYVTGQVLSVDGGFIGAGLLFEPEG